MSQPQILIVHPDPSTQSLLASMLQSLGLGIEETTNDRMAVRRLERGGISLVVSSVDPSDPDALELLSYLRRKHSKVPVLCLFPDPACQKARDASRSGATVLGYPAPATELRASVTQALDAWREATEGLDAGNSNGNGNGNGNGSGGGPSNGSRPIPAPFQVGSSFRGDSRGEQAPAADPAPSLKPKGPQPIGDSAGLRQALELAMAAAPTRTPVVMVGEPGTGKSLIARSIHAASPRADRPFVEVVCGGLDEVQLERELFGQEPGRGAADGLPGRPGKIARADGGTLFLDEVGNLPMSIQRQLLRLLTEGEYEPHGASEPVRSDVRLILATHENLPALVDQGRFRRDLYDRVGIICLRLPPLRDRGGDIETLAEGFRARFAAEFSKPVLGFTPDALDLLCRHDWPGNVRELESVVQRGVALCQGARVTSANLSLGFGPPRVGRGPSYAPRPHLPIGIRPLKEALEEPEKQIIIQALQALNWNRQETARVLDINRTTLYKKMKKYGLLLDEPALLN